MKKNTIIIMLALLLCCTVAYILLNNKDCKNNKDINNISNKENKVVSYIEKKDNVPYITISGFDSINEKIKEYYKNNNNLSYSYHYYKDVLIIYFTSSKTNGYEGIIDNKVIYLDLQNKKELSAIDVYDMFAVADFDTVCKQNVDDVTCGIDNIKNSLIVIPTGSFLYIGSMEMGFFNPFYVAIK